MFVKWIFEFGFLLKADYFRLLSFHLFLVGFQILEACSLVGMAPLVNLDMEIMPLTVPLSKCHALLISMLQR